MFSRLRSVAVLLLVHLATSNWVATEVAPSHCSGPARHVEFARQALALRLLAFRGRDGARERSSWFRSIHERALAYAGDVPPQPGLDDVAVDLSAMRMADQGRTGGQGSRTGGSIEELRRLHNLSIEALEYLSLFVSYEVLPYPIVTGARGPGSAATIAEALSLLRSRPHSLAVFTSEDVHPLARFALGTAESIDKLLPFANDMIMPLIREKLQGIRAIWLVEPTEVEWTKAEDLRTTLKNVEEFVDHLRGVKDYLDVTLASFIGGGLPIWIGGRDRSSDEEVYKFEIEELVEQALNIAAWNGDIPRSLDILVEAAALIEVQQERSTRGTLKNRYAHLAQRAAELLHALRQDPEPVLRAWRARSPVGPEGPQILWGLLGDGLIVPVPAADLDDDVSVTAPGDFWTLEAHVVAPLERIDFGPPWLSGIEVQLKAPAWEHSTTGSPVTGVPLVLENLESGHREVRPLLHVPFVGGMGGFDKVMLDGLPHGTYRLTGLSASPEPAVRPSPKGVLAGGARSQNSAANKPRRAIQRRLAILRSFVRRSGHSRRPPRRSLFRQLAAAA